MNSFNHISVKTGKQSGFTLVEAALVVVVLSLILTPLFGFMAQQIRQDHERAEEALNERVLAALSQHYKLTGRYPCPADETLAPGHADFGVEDCPAAHTPAPGGILTGALPVNTLNVPFQDSVNRYGWKYIYAVSDGFWDTTEPLGATGLLSIEDNSGNPPIAGAQFVIVNPGKDGKGSRSLLGAASTIACSGALDTENCDGDTVFRVSDYAPLDNPNASGYFDDSISYSLAREESTFWTVDTNNNGANVAGGTNIINRNAGNVGIGTFSNTAAVNAKLHVRGGDVLITDDGTTTGGSLNADQNITADGTVRAGNNVEAETRAIAPIFWYGTP